MTFRLLPLKLFGDGESLSRDEISLRGFLVKGVEKCLAVTFA